MAFGHELVSPFSDKLSLDRSSGLQLRRGAVLRFAAAPSGCNQPCAPFSPEGVGTRGVFFSPPRLRRVELGAWPVAYPVWARGRVCRSTSGRVGVWARQSVVALVAGVLAQGLAASAQGPSRGAYAPALEGPWIVPRSSLPPQIPRRLNDPGRRFWLLSDRQLSNGLPEIGR